MEACVLFFLFYDLRLRGITLRYGGGSPEKKSLWLQTKTLPPRLLVCFVSNKGPEYYSRLKEKYEKFISGNELIAVLWMRLPPEPALC